MSDAYYNPLRQWCVYIYRERYSCVYIYKYTIQFLQRCTHISPQGKTRHFALSCYFARMGPSQQSIAFTVFWNSEGKVNVALLRFQKIGCVFQHPAHQYCHLVWYQRLHLTKHCIWCVCSRCSCVPLDVHLIYCEFHLGCCDLDEAAQTRKTYTCVSWCRGMDWMCVRSCFPVGFLVMLI